MLAEDIRDDVSPAIDAYLRERFPALRNLTPDTPLLSSGAVDSLGVLDLMMFLAENFGITLEDDDFSPDNIETPAKLAAFVQARR